MIGQYICNYCGKGFDMWDVSEHFGIHQQCGYGTKFDGDKLELNFCCACMEKIIDNCVVSPVKANT